MVSQPTVPAEAGPRLRRALGLWDLILYGMIVIQPTAPMPVYGVMSQRARGHAVTTVLIAMVAMLFTAISYGRMARAYPSAGSAFTYVGSEIHPALGYVTGWSMAMDYMLNPIVCTILCSKFALNFLPEVPYAVWVILFVVLFSCLNLFGIRTSARINTTLAAGMGVVILIFLAAAARYVMGIPHDIFIPGGIGGYITRRIDLHRLRWDFDAVRRSRESQTQHFAGDRSGLLSNRGAGVHRSLRSATGVAEFAALPGRGHCLRSRRRAGRRAMVVYADQCHVAGGNSRFRDGLAAWRGAAALWHGKGECAAKVFFRSH